MERRLAGLSLAMFGGVNLRQRVLSSIILAPIVLAATYLGGWVFQLFVLAAMLLALHEWLRLIDPRLPQLAGTFSYVALAVILLLSAVQSFGTALAALLLLTLASFVLAFALRRKDAFGIAFGLPYLAGSGLALLYLRALPEKGSVLVIYLLLAVWGTDIGAYGAGCLIGGPKLAPVISPHKTWAGLLGGMALAALFGYGAAAWFGFAHPLAAGGIAILLAAVAQAGDLFKSFFKRRAGVKDSGRLIPGHGGMLDRIDGLIFAAVVLALIENRFAW